jgi:chemotaxis protein MotB
VNKFIQDEEDDEEELDWKDSYSDLMTYLLAVFVLLLSFALINYSAVNRQSVAEQQSMVDIVPQISVLSDREGVLPEQSSLEAKKEDDFNELYESMKEYIEEEGLSEKLDVTKQGIDQILLRVSASVFFDSGSADINTNAEPFLDKISDLFVTHENSIKMVRIEGHTDNRPMKSARFDSNWELSVSRAVNVLKHLVEISGLKQEKFSAVGYSEFYPITANDNDAGRAKNRRVDFFIEAVD